MKKFLLTMAVALTALFATAQTKTYTDNLVVTIDGESTEPQETTISVAENADGTYCLSLNNFVLGGEIKVGNIVVDNIQATDKHGIKEFATLQNINITAGEGNADEWLGPLLGEVPVDIKGKMTDEKLYCTIDIDMSATLEQVIYVTFGSDMSAVVNTKEYTDNLVVAIDGESTEPQETTIYVTEYNDGTYSLSLNNFVLGDMIKVGNIVVDNIQATDKHGIKEFATLQNINITAGEGNADDWLGPMLGEVPVDIKGKMTDEKLYCTIDIDMSATLEQVIYVTFGTEFEEKKPEIDLNKAYRVKNVETGNYLNVAAYNADNTTGPTGSVTVAEAAVNGDQIFNVEDAGEGKYYLVSLNGHYIVCRPWNVDACNDGQKTVLGFEFTNGTDFNITCEKGYFKVENVGGVTYPFCDAPAAAAATWTLEEIEVPEGIDNIVENTVKSIYDITGRRVNAVTAPGIYIINGKKCIVK